MLTTEKIIETLDRYNIKSKFWNANYGLEKENIRVTQEGHLATTPHPSIFGDKLTNPYITTDFAEAQMELITPVSKSLEEVLAAMENIESAVNSEIGDELLWPQSIPPILPNEEDIAIAKYNEEAEGKSAREYREKLAKTYGKKKQMLSGIHYNFSFDDDILSLLYREHGQGRSFREFKDDIYLRLSRNFFKYRWMLLYLFGASPLVHRSYDGVCLGKMEEFDKDTYYFQSATSFRNGKCGYRNRVEEFVPYDTLGNYVAKVEEMVASGKIQNEKEYYSPLRLKSKDGSWNRLKGEGIEYIEIRLLDINPFAINGIDIETLYLVQAYLFYMLNIVEGEYGEEVLDRDNKNHYTIACCGLNPKSHIYKDNEIVDFREYGLRLIEEMESFYKKHELLTNSLKKGIEYARDAFRDSNKTLAARLKASVKEKNYIDFHLERARDYKKKSLASSYKMKSYEDLELSTQILLKESIIKGVKYSVVDRKANFITLEKGSKLEYVKQATKTSLDSYISYLVMENKLVSKDILDRKGVKTPKGYSFDRVEGALAIYSSLDKRGLVIKPNNTNFGIGISIFKEFPTYKTYEEAILHAFEKDHTVLVEEFISGREYRFLVMGDEVVGILHRVPANVEGNGKNTIKELVDVKNLDPLRGKGYVSPLEKINLGRIEEVFLEEQGKTFDYIPQKGEVVYLRENSNISTGGDSIDYTDVIDESYKVEAIKAAKSVGAKICGVDMMIEDIKTPLKNENYGIIEVNFNPAIHIHCFPYKGKDRKAGRKILDMLGY